MWNKEKAIHLNYRNSSRAEVFLELRLYLQGRQLQVEENTKESIKSLNENLRTTTTSFVFSS